MPKFIMTGAVALLAIGMAAPVFAAGTVTHPRINYHAGPAATSTATSTPGGTRPGVHLVPGSHAKKPVFKTLQGTVKTVSTDSLVLTVRSADYTVTAASTTRIVNRVWRKIALSDIQVGDKVRVFGKVSSTTVSAQIIRDISLPAVGPEATTTATTTVTHAPRIRYKDGTSTNWSGYAIETNLANPQSGAVSDVKGSWVVPSVSCGNTNTYSASWVGIDGDTSKTVEQTGTEQDCINGSPSYYAWFEMYPKPSFSVNLSINPGDTINAEVKYVGGKKYQLTLTDTTTGTFTTTQSANAQRQSAEWIMEAPSSGGILPLANFGTIPFSNASATLNGHSGTISNVAWQNDQITMVNSSGTVKAMPSALSSDGSGFTVAWKSSN